MHYLLIDAGYIDRVAFNLIVHFERVLGRRVPGADLARWLECVALDGGVRPQAGSPGGIRAVFLHPAEKQAFDHFSPARFDSEVDGRAFQSNLGEFAMQCASSEGVANAADFFCQSLEAVAALKDVESLILVPDAEDYGASVRQTLARLTQKEVTLLSMQPLGGLFCRQEQLGYSVLAALGIRSDELG